MTDILGQIVEGFVNLLKPDNPISIVLIAGIIVGVFFAWRTAMRLKEPDAKRIDRFVFTMPKIGHQFGGTVYDYPEIDEPNLEGLKEIREAKDIAQFILDNKKDMHFYLLKYDGYGTISSGMALVLTHNRIDDQDYSEQMESVFDFVQLSKVHRRLLSQATSAGRIYENAVDFDGRWVDLIYYPMQNPDPQKQVITITNSHATLQIAAQIKEWVVTRQKSNFNEIQRRAAERGKELAESELKATTAKYNFVRRQWAKKEYWQDTLSTIGSSLSLAIIGFVVGGAAIFLPDVFKQYMANPLYTEFHYRAFAVLAGIIGIWVLQHFRKT